MNHTTGLDDFKTFVDKRKKTLTDSDIFDTVGFTIARESQGMFQYFVNVTLNKEQRNSVQRVLKNDKKLIEWSRLIPEKTSVNLGGDNNIEQELWGNDPFHTTGGADIGALNIHDITNEPLDENDLVPFYSPEDYGVMETIDDVLGGNDIMELVDNALDGNDVDPPYNGAKCLDLSEIINDPLLDDDYDGVDPFDRETDFTELINDALDDNGSHTLEKYDDHYGFTPYG
jgi:hypothetical protein